VDTPTLGRSGYPRCPDGSRERWLRQMHRVDGAPLANATRAKIRSLMSVLSITQYAMNGLEQGRTHCGCSARARTPEIAKVAGAA